MSPIIYLVAFVLFGFFTGLGFQFAKRLVDKILK